ncbi:dihydrofolate reductase [Paenibacillus sp. SEL3]|jgi:dihydrofolate reductase|uniref:Dihydrofolate reductase n=1 Tax=Paenibacillus polymyxa TaxID=1406 RepID=A0A8I1INE3_PAEPO|nr:MULTISPECIES: dihydrofolate reductase [Paenibacillus]KAF6574932.1 dihydrofolate reductase [Paenibacillus sp. EKM206P]KAF6590394.1 dihydrofolate reductase [Paenibacillus sp. EKM205P]MBM0634184.1 dihydrofolate reductase [Paenibacillus polymyxa]MBO3286965.1 dihydrofolate reductase [Paenibacillus polymyxa]MBP1307410.1 dihydrofolate reductase [Paenibacillus sp. 1182]
MGISMIWAMAQNGVIGRDNKLPWRLPRDMAFFKEQTINKTVLMGRKTWESFGGKSLPNRRNVVLTRDLRYQTEGAEVIHSMEEGLQLAKQEELMVIGGAEIYSLFWPHADRLIVTRIEEVFEGDTTFPELDWNGWNIVSETPGIKDDKNPYEYRFVVYERTE